MPWIEAQKEQRLARKQIESLVDQITRQELEFHRRLFDTFKLTRGATLLALGLTIAASVFVVVFRRDLTVRVAAQRQELLQLVEESGGLTGRQLGRFEEKLDSYAEEPLSWR